MYPAQSFKLQSSSPVQLEQAELAEQCTKGSYCCALAISCKVQPLHSLLLVQQDASVASTCCVF